MTGQADYGWYGDDFTGATDTLATLAERGYRAMLFLDIPDAAQLQAAGPLDAIGIAGATRSMPPDRIAGELDRAGRLFADRRVRLIHYKCCSTFDSSPRIGSIGAAVAALRPYASNPLLPIIGGQPNLGRYCLFGQLFAAAGSGGMVHRIDRHPTMSRHPVTPMAEADLRLHLAAQGLSPIALVDYRGDGSAREPTGTVLFDVAQEGDLDTIGRAMAKRLDDGPMLAIGASSVARAYASAMPAREVSALTSLPAADGPVLALVGSLSPVTSAQVEAATAYRRLAIDPHRLLGEQAYSAALAAEARAQLGSSEPLMLITDRIDEAPHAPADVAAATGRLLRDILTEIRPGRLVVAGGDTSTLAIRALDCWGLSYLAPCVAGAPLCRIHADGRLDGLEVVLKGGQMGPPSFFDRVAETV